MKTNRKITVFSLLLSIIFIFQMASCKKENDYYQISEEMKGYFYFLQGSYWIYRDDISGQVDSAYVERINSGKAKKYTYGEGDGYYFDFCISYINSMFLQELQINDPWCEPVTSKSYIKLEQNLGSINPIIYDAGVLSGEHKHIGCGNPHCTGDLGVELLSEINIHDTSYSNVLHTTFFPENFSADSDTFTQIDYYFKKNVGLLKMEIKFNDSVRVSMGLLRYNAVQ